MLPTPQSKAFLRYVTDWMRDTHQQQWDQAAWNEVRVCAPMTDLGRWLFLRLGIRARYAMHLRGVALQ